MDNDFKNLLSDVDLLRAIDEMGYKEATPIQTQSIKLVKAGHDVIGQSQTGTGKTAAFGLPTLEKIDTDSRKLQAIVLCPTRELAMQVAEEFRKFLKYKTDLKVLAVYGGQPIDRQIMALKKGVQVVIGTPGRVIDHINRKTLRLDDIKSVILDEADEMLNMGFREDIEEILKSVPEERQTVLFSATMPKEILQLTKLYQKDPEHVKIKNKELTTDTIEQSYIVVKERAKGEALARFIEYKRPELAIVFCNTKKRVDEVVEELQKRNIFAEGLHGDLKQIQRDNVMKKFRNRTLQVLVATDVAARGIDVDDVDVVFNYDLPTDFEYYVHRIGRTGRAGRKGYSYTFVTAREIRKFNDLMKYTKATAEKKEPPNVSDLVKSKKESYVEKIQKDIDKVGESHYADVLEALIEKGYTAEQVAVALIHTALYDDNLADVVFDEKPRRDKERSSRSDRPERSDRKKGERTADEDMTRLFVNIGKRDRVQVKDIVGCIANETGVEPRYIGRIDIFDEFTFVDIDNAKVSTVLDNLAGVQIKKRDIEVEKAKVKKQLPKGESRGARPAKKPFGKKPMGNDRPSKPFSKNDDFKKVKKPARPKQVKLQDL